jgi:hypothetical protein
MDQLTILEENQNREKFNKEKAFTAEISANWQQRVGMDQLTIHEEAAAEYPIYQWPSFRNKTKRNSTRRHSVAGSKKRGGMGLALRLSDMFSSHFVDKTITFLVTFNESS